VRRKAQGNIFGLCCYRRDANGPLCRSNQPVHLHSSIGDSATWNTWMVAAHTQLFKRCLAASAKRLLGACAAKQPKPRQVVTLVAISFIISRSSE
jgi:hypothetical protein